MSAAAAGAPAPVSVAGPSPRADASPGPRWPRALYVHVPFCLSACPYCDFVVYAGSTARGPRSLLPALAEALLVELELRADELERTVERPTGAALETVYLGGGTPSLLAPRQLGRLLEAIDRRLGIAAGAEITLEANPGPADRGDPAAFAMAGVTRLSIGAQSFVPVELRRLGRRHGPADVATTVALARSAGIGSVGLDLLYDVPGQTFASWWATLEAALALEPDHVSAYALTLDDPDVEGLTGPAGDHLATRPGARRWRERARAQQDDDRAAGLYLEATELLEAVGFAWYEISNWARPGHRCRHNLVYWRRQAYLALGPGAHGFDGARRRWWNAARLEPYLAALLPDPGGSPRLPPGGEERLDEGAALAEEAILALRLSDGLDAERLERLAAMPQLGKALARARAADLLERDDTGRIVLTRRGRLLAGELFAHLV